MKTVDGRTHARERSAINTRRIVVAANTSERDLRSVIDDIHTRIGRASSCRKATMSSPVACISLIRVADSRTERR